MHNFGTLTNEGTLETTDELVNFQTIENNGTFTIPSSSVVVSNYSALNNNTNATMVNNGNIENLSGATLKNMGTIENNLQLQNSGTIENYVTINNSSNIINYNVLENIDTLNNLSAGTLTNEGVFNNKATLASEGQFVNKHIFNNSSVATCTSLDNEGSITNTSTGILTFSGTLDNKLSGTLVNDGALISQILINSGTLTNNLDLTNLNQLVNVNDLINNGNFFNNGSMNCDSSSTTANSGLFQNEITGTVSINNMFTNNISGTVINKGSFVNENSGSFVNEGIFISSNQLRNDGNFTNNNSINNSGNFENRDTVENNGIFDNNGTLENKNSYTNVAFLTNRNTVENSGTLENQGTFSNNSGATLTNTGTFNNDGGTFEIDTGSTFNQSGTLNLNSGTFALGAGITFEVDDNVTVGTVQAILESGTLLQIDNRTNDVTFQMPIIQAGSLGNTGGLTLNSDVKVVLTGENTYSGETNVNSGILYVNGPSLASPGILSTKVIVQNATFGGDKYTRVKFDPAIAGSGYVELQDNAILAPGGDGLFGQLTVDKDITFSHTSTVFDLEVDSVNNTDKIVVGGVATLGGDLQIEAAAGNFLAGQRITVVEAPTINGTFDNVFIPQKPNGEDLFRIEYTPNSVDLVVLTDSIFEEGVSSGTVPSGNPNKVVNYMLSQESIDPNSDLGFVLESLGLLSEDKLKQALNLMHPGFFATLEGINLTASAQIMQVFTQNLMKVGSSHGNQSAVSQLEPSLTASVGSRPFYPNSPVRMGCYRDENKHHDVWIKPFGSWNTQDRIGGQRGVNYETVGVLTGYDYLLNHFYVGGALGYAYTNFRWQESAGEGRIDQVYGGIYGSYFMDYFSATLSTMVGGNFYKTNRHIKYDAPLHPGALLDRTARSHNSGIQWTNHLGLIGDFSPLSLPFQIFGNVDHFYLHNGSFKESGAQSLNLKVNGKTSNALRSELGLSSSHTFDFKGGCWTPFAQLSYVNKTLLSSSKYRSGFIGQVGTFSVNTTSKGINQVSPGLGMEFANKKGMSLLINGRAELNGVVKSYFADMRLDYVF